MLIILFLPAGLCYGQIDYYDEAQKFTEKAVEFGSRGKFKEAGEAFKKALEIR